MWLSFVLFIIKSAIQSGKSGYQVVNALPLKAYLTGLADWSIHELLSCCNLSNMPFDCTKVQLAPRVCRWYPLLQTFFWHSSSSTFTAHGSFPIGMRSSSGSSRLNLSRCPNASFHWSGPRTISALVRRHPRHHLWQTNTCRWQRPHSRTKSRALTRKVLLLCYVPPEKRYACTRAD